MADASRGRYECRTLSNGMAVFRSAERATDENAFRVAVFCGQHGRELVSPEVCLELMRALSSTEAAPAEDWTSWLFGAAGEAPREAQQEVRWWIAPLVNPHGRDVMQFGRDRCTRKNAAGVDLNRNFPVRSARHASPAADPASEEYGGMYAGSEPETADCIELLREADAHLTVSVHSGAPGWILLPYDHSAGVRLPGYSTMVRAARKAREAIGCDECMIGRSSLLLYESHGTLMDYALQMGEDADEMRFAYTLEVYGGLSPRCEERLRLGDCFCTFNPPEHEVATVARRWSDFARVLAKSCRALSQNR